MISFRGILRLLQGNRNFRLLWSAQVISEVGDWLYAVVLYSLLLQITGRAESIGIALVLQLLPQLFVSPMAGVLNDRISRQRVMIATDLGRAVVIAAMLLVRGAEQLWLLYILLVLETVLWAFFEPGRSAVIPNITRNDDERLTANTLGGVTWAAAFFLGSSLGGFLAAAFGRDFVFAFDAASFLFSAWLLSRMRFAEPHLVNAPKRTARDLLGAGAFTEGLSYAWAEPKRRATLMVKAGVGLLGSNYVILSVLGQREFALKWFTSDAAAASMMGISTLMAARGFGAMTGPWLVGRWAGHDPLRMRLGIAAGFAMVLLGYGTLSQSKSLALAFAGIALAHAGASTAFVFSTNLLQTLSDDAFRGRLMSTDFAGMVISISLSSYSAGWAIDHGVPARQAALATALVMLLPIGLWLWITRDWRESSILE
ncbi:MAG: MFS transporter [Bryobacteraceae bacterium]|nr:MFS transporter [Bryobacteraceae bacterium]